MKSSFTKFRYVVRGTLMTLCTARNHVLKSTFLFFKYAVLGSLVFFSVALSQPDTLTIIHVNDTHSNLSPYGAGKHGGIARAAGPNGGIRFEAGLLLRSLWHDTYSVVVTKSDFLFRCSSVDSAFYHDCGEDTAFDFYLQRNSGSLFPAG